MSASIPRAGKRSRQQSACASASAVPTIDDVPVNGPDPGVMPTDERPAIGDAGAAMRDQVAMDASPGAGCSSVPHDIHTVQHDAPVELSTECFSVAELKQRALRMFITSSGGAPRASGCGLVMGATTALLIINVTKAIEQLMGTPRKPGSHRAEMIRCCSELDKEEARGWLVADAVGRPLLHRNDDRTQNDAREVGKRVLERSGKAAADVAKAKDIAQAKVRAAKRTAAKDASQHRLVTEAEAGVATAVAGAESAPIDLDLPNVTSGPERPASYWRWREVLEADARATAVADEAVAAEAAARNTRTLADRAWQAADRAKQAAEGPGALFDADARWFTASRVALQAASASRRAAANAEVGRAQAALVRVVAMSEGVDVRPGSAAKRRREDERAALIAADADVQGVIDDMITAMEAHQRAEPFWISLERWHYLAEEERWTREMCASTARRYGNNRPRAPEEAWARYRERIMAGFEADAQAFEMKCRAMAWAAEAKEDPAVLAMARRFEACDDTDDDPYPDPDNFPASPDDDAWDAAVADWEARREAAEPLVARAERVVSERILGRTPWKSALRMRLQDMGELCPLSHVYGRWTLYGHVSHADAE